MKRDTVIACFVNTFGGGIIGYNVGIVSGLSLYLIKCTLFSESDSINVSLLQGIFTSAILVFAAIGAPIAVSISKAYGMKKGLFILSIIAFLFPILMVLYKNYWYITIMRGLLGLGIGFSSSLCTLYSNRIVDDAIKGRIGSIFQVSVTFFILVAQIMNYVLIPTFDSSVCYALPDYSWKLQLGLSAILGLGLFIVMLFGREVKNDAQTKEKHRLSLYSIKNMKWIVFAFMLALMNQFTGINGVMYYCAQILDSAGVQNVLFTQMIVVGLWNMLTVFIFMAIVDKMKRKTIFIVALSVMLIGSILIIISFMKANLPILSLVGLVLFILGFEIGPGPLFYIMACQDFPPLLVEQGLSLSNIFLYILNITIALTFPMITDGVGGGYTFVILAGFQLICMVYFGVVENDSKKTPKTLPAQPKQERKPSISPIC